MSLARLELAGNDFGELAKWTSSIREEAGIKLPIIADLDANKVKIGKLSQGQQMLEEGSLIELVLGKQPQKSPKELPLECSVDLNLKKRSLVFLSDGQVVLEVSKKTKRGYLAKVKIGGETKSFGLAQISEQNFTSGEVTEQELSEIEFGLSMGYEYLATSRFSSAKDIAYVRSLIPPEVKLIVKIQSREAIENLEEVVKAADALMISRDDFDWRFEPEEIPVIEKKVILKARLAGKPLILASPLLLSLVSWQKPNRVETAEVAAAVFSRVDALTLFEETAQGKEPLLALKTAFKIVAKAERFLYQTATLF